MQMLSVGLCHYPILVQSDSLNIESSISYWYHLHVLSIITQLRSIVRPSAHSGDKNWQKVATAKFEVSSLPAAFQIPYKLHSLRDLCKISAKITYLALLILTVDSEKTGKLKIAKNFTL